VILPGVIKVMEASNTPRRRRSLWEPFTRFPDSISVRPGTSDDGGRSAIEADAIPAYRKLLEFFNKEYLSGARQTIAAS